MNFNVEKQLQKSWKKRNQFQALTNLLYEFEKMIYEFILDLKNKKNLKKDVQ